MNRRVLLTAVFVATSAPLFVRDATAQMTLRFSSFEPPVAFVTKEILTPWAAKTSEDSGGSLKIEMFAGGTLGDPAAQLKLVIDGVVDVAWVVASYAPGRFDDTTVVELPFVVESVKEGSLALTRLLQKGALRGFDGVKVVGLFCSPPNEIHSTFSVIKPADLNGKKLRAAGPNQLATLASLGATPIGGLTAPKIAEAIQRGDVDGTLNDWNAMASFRLNEIAFHHLRVPMGSITFMVIMNKAKYESLAPAAKAAVDRNSGEVFARVFGEKLDARNTEVAATIEKDLKHKTTKPDTALIAEWKAAVGNVEAQWTKEDPTRLDLLKAFKEELAAIRAGK